ncbi:MAG: ABC transporter ATP-binding protein, partial [Treponema sp.]|nr:ABC transporter ATP-binding protein [Treponema sp.]
MAYIEMKGITKRFGTVLANDDVSLEVDRGEILALLGENGSGKSTLVNMLSGIYIPDSGSLSIGGKPRFFRSPQDAIAAGIGMVHQHFKLIPVMSAWENISLGEKPGPNPFIEKKRINRKISGIEERFGLAVDHGKKIYGMSVGERQAVEIIKMLYRGADVLVLDEPTAVLTPQETEQLFVMLGNMKDQGCAIIIITHKLNEVMEISDRVTVMRKGKNAGTLQTKDTNPLELTELMVGASISLEIPREESPAGAEAFLQARNLSYLNEDEVPLLRKVSFDLYGGEILGVAGIAGSGQRELCEIIAGLRKAAGGELVCGGKNLLGLSPRAIRDRGVSMSFIPEDRLGMGLVPGMSVTDNILLRSYDKKAGLFVDRNSGRAQAEKIVERYNISTPSVQHLVRKLSGGNIQKVLLG